MLKDLLIGLIALLAFAILLQSFITGLNKSIDIQESLYYDAEQGRMIYIEKGV